MQKIVTIFKIEKRASVDGGSGNGGKLEIVPRRGLFIIC